MSETAAKGPSSNRAVKRLLLFGAIGGVIGFGISYVYSSMGST